MRVLLGFMIFWVVLFTNTQIYKCATNEDSDKENQILVHFKDNAVHNINNKRIEKSRKLGEKTQLIKLKKQSDEQGVIDEFKNRSDVLYVEKNKKIALLDMPNDTFYNYQWGLTNTNASQAWNYSVYANKTAVVAVIDSGIDSNHPDFVGRIADGGFDFYANTNDTTDTIGHGTSVCGVIAAKSNNGIGIAGVCGEFAVKVLPLKVTNASSEIYLSDLIDAINYAIQQKVDVINISLGSTDASDIENAVVQQAIQSGITVVASAGNSGDSVYHYPASYDNVLSVGATSYTNLRAYFSTFNDKVDFVAPGYNLYTCKTDGTYGYSSGTSFSAPMVSAQVAILKALASELTPSQIEKIFQSTSLDLGDIGFDNLYGYGLIQNHEAVIKALDTTRPQHVQMLDNSLIMQYPIFKLQDGTEILDLNSSGDLSITATIANRLNIDKSTSILTALYSSKNRLISVKSTPISISANNSKNYNLTISIPDLEDRYILKIFYFDNMGNCTPLIVPILLNQQ